MSGDGFQLENLEPRCYICIIPKLGILPAYACICQLHDLESIFSRKSSTTAGIGVQCYLSSQSSITSFTAAVTGFGHYLGDLRLARHANFLVIQIIINDIVTIVTCLSREIKIES